eukprot:538745-Rhodomonas_salina.2
MKEKGRQGGLDLRYVSSAQYPGTALCNKIPVILILNSFLGRRRSRTALSDSSTGGGHDCWVWNYGRHSDRDNRSEFGVHQQWQIRSALKACNVCARPCMPSK